jgi:hypothetical protein
MARENDAESLYGVRLPDVDERHTKRKAQEKILSPF